MVYILLVIDYDYLSQEVLIRRPCEQCGRIGVKTYYIDNTKICSSCYRQLKGYRYKENYLGNNFGPVYEIPNLREIRMKETNDIKIASRDRILQYYKDYRKERWAEMSKRSVENKSKWRKLWNREPWTFSKKVILESEKFVADKVLPDLGFTDIFLVTKEKPNFVCDILAMDKIGTECAIDVKMSVLVDLSKSKVSLIKRLKRKLIVVHLKQDFQFWYVNEVKNFHSSAVAAFKIYLQQKV